ncbi:MAG: M12 family metallo-peptidase [Saprospiraceae bacterium]|nr:M12 family metallo-peptidase [Saprospiraceae bacterium]MDW8229272.1 M12 family metallo-peptidase [Saprospiraceae bacterium]
MRSLFYPLFLFLLPFSVFSQAHFSDAAASEILEVSGSDERALPERFRWVRVDVSSLAQTLAAAPLRFSAARGAEVVVALPMPDGRWARFRVAEAPVMPPELQAKYPDIRSYTGVGLDDPTASLKCDLTPRGFHAMILSARHEPVFLDPYPLSMPGYAIVYFKSALKAPKAPWVCSIGESPAKASRFEGTAPELTGDCLLRRYRLALACTGEYAQFHGGTKPLALAAMVTTLNRVNGVYERDLGILMSLVPNNDTLIFLDPATDGYTNNNLSSMLSQNVTKCNTLIGPENYDIGHVFGTGNGGVAGLGVVCNNSTKARGVTGRSAPVGDPFDIDYVAHEMGHQFGANHTQNNNCSRNNATAMEPGSGSTIMGYAGICNPNVQNNSDDYFHAISLQEIRQYAVLGAGNVCAQKVDLGNQSPIVTSVGGATFTIPRSTPFVLTAAGEDADGDALTYCWEQMNNQTASMPPQPGNAVGPMFRSLKPTPAPERYFPALPFILSNTTNPWERLPAVGRTMRFRVTARDNHPGGGCTGLANVDITVAANSGPFAVLEPNTATTWYVGQTQTVRWDVARTDTAPVNCTEVLLLLSTDGGWTYPYVLAGPLPNTGEAAVEVPLLLSDSCRVRVQAVGNIFFDVSDQNFRIELPPAPTFLIDTDLSAQVQRCAGDSLAFWVRTRSIAGFSQAITFALDGLPPDAVASVSPNPVPAGDSVLVVIRKLTTPGQYALSLVSTSYTLTRERKIALHVVEAQPAAPLLAAPLDGQRDVTPGTVLRWMPVANALRYEVQISQTPAFALDQTVWETTVADAEAPINSALQPGAVYYWRVRAENACGQSQYSPVWAFQTARKVCGLEFASENVPVTIPTTSAATVSSTLGLTDPRPLADLDAWVNIRHTWVGDLRARLIGPGGDTVLLFDQPGVPATVAGCSGDNITATFDDEAALTAADFEKTCNTTPPAISGVFQPLQALARFYPKPASGVWHLGVSDLANDDGGAIEAWGLRCCFWDTTQAALLLKNEILLLAAGQTAPIDDNLLALDLAGETPENGVFTLLAQPEHGQLLRNGLPLSVGDAFTQADINDGLIAYRHNGNAATQDAFAFDALQATANQWLHNAIFRIQIFQNDLVVSVVLLDSLRCHNGATARLLATVQGGKPPYSYQLSTGGPARDSGLFENLSAGSYSVVVTDGWGFTAVSPLVVVPNPDPTVVLALASNDSIEVRVSGGNPPYRYRLGNGAYQEEPLFTDLPNDTYTVEVQDAKGCTASTQVIVYVGPLAVLNIQTTPVSCQGGSNGTVRITAGGGVPPYSYSLDGLDFQAENAFQNLPAGQYTVVVEDKQGTTVTQVFTIAEPPALVVSATAVLNRIEVVASGGTGVLLYRLNGGPYQPQPVFGGLANGTYTVTVRDANGCTAETTVVVDVPPLQLLTVDIEGEILCAGQTVRVLVSATGGVPPYAYALDSGPFQAASIWSAVGAGAHVITVRDAAGNQVISDTFFIYSPLPLEATAAVFGPTATVSANGGTPPYRYSIDGADWTLEDFFANLSNGMHFVVVADVNNCTDTVSFEVNYVPMTALLTRTPPSCAGASDGAFEVEILGGVPPFTCAGVPLSDNRCARGHLSAGVYTLTLSDALGDTLVVSVMLNDPPVLVITVSAQLNTLTAAASGGTGALVYSLDGLTFQGSPVFANLPNGIYTVTVRDANGCTAVSEPVEIDIISTRTPEAKNQVRLYPNPNTGRFWVELAQPAAEALQISLYDLRGQVVWQQTCSDASGKVLWEIRLPDVPAGAYVLYGMNSRQHFVERVLITKGSD